MLAKLLYKHYGAIGAGFIENKPAPPLNRNEAFIRQNNVAARMLASGFGLAMPGLTPNRGELFVRIENEARAARRGMWVARAS